MHLGTKISLLDIEEYLRVCWPLTAAVLAVLLDIAEEEAKRLLDRAVELEAAVVAGPWYAPPEKRLGLFRIYMADVVARWQAGEADYQHRRNEEFVHG